MLKKLLTLTLVLFGALTLAACNPDPDPVDCDENPTHEDCVVEKTDLEKLSEALDELSLPAETSENLVLPSAGLHDVVITWVSDDTDVIGNDGVVTIPLFSEGDQTVTITATLTLGEQTFTKDYDVTVKAALVETDQEKADNAIKSLLLVDTIVIADLTLLTEHQTYAVVWTTSNDMYISAAGVVTRPDSDTGNVSVTLTATLTVGTATATKDFVITVQAEEAATVYTSVSDMYATATLNDYIEFTGIVTGTFDGGYFISDGTNSLGIYAAGDAIAVAIGDQVKVRGFYAVYNTLYQLGNIVSQEVLSTENVNPAEGTAVVKTVAEMLALDSSVSTIHGAYYTITGTIELRGDYGNVYIVDGDDAVLIYYYSNEDSLAALEAEAGKEVTITVFYYTDHGSNGPMLAFDGLAADITVSALPDDEALDADIDALEDLIPAITLESIVLPTEGPNGTVFSAWASDTTAVLGNDGAFVALGVESTIVTFTATATKGTFTETVTVEVLVPVLSTVQEVLDMENGDLFHVSGIVYDISYYGLFIENNGAYIFIYNKEYSGPVVVGDEIEMLGSRSVYNGLTQINLKSEMTVLQSGQAVPTAMPSTVSGVMNDLVSRGTIATVTGTVSIEGDYSNVFLTDSAGGKIEVYYRSDADELKVHDGLIITVDVITYHDELVLFKGVAADATVEASFSEAYTAQAAADYLDLGMIDELNVNLELPTENTMATATITWATSDAGVVTDAGVITMVSGSNPMATLTASVVVGTTTVTRDFVVTLMDLDDNVALTVTEALAETDGSMVLVQGVITGTYYDERVIQDAAGAAIWVDSSVGGNIGDEIVVYGTLATYDSYGNNNRQLDSASLIDTVSTGNALVVNPETDLATIFAQKDLMQRYTATFTVTVMEDYGNVLFNTVPVTYYLEDGTTVDEILEEQGFKFSKSQFAPYFDDVFTVGDQVELTFTILDYSFNNVRMVNVEVSLTDEQALAAATAALDIPATVIDNITLATEMYGVTIAWTSDNAAIGVDGTVTRPLNGEGDAMVTLTATLTIGTETPVVVPIMVTVSEEAPPTDVATALTADSDAPLFLTGIVTSVLSDGTFTIEDADGTAIYIDDRNTSLTWGDLVIAVGDEVVVTGDMNLYNGIKSVDEVSVVTVGTQGNAITAPIAITDLAAFRAAISYSDFAKRYTFTNLPILETGYYSYFYEPVDGENRMGIVAGMSDDTLVMTAGEYVTFTATLYGSNGSITDITKILRFSVTDAADYTIVTPAP